MITAQILPKIGSAPVGSLEISDVPSIADLRAIITGSTSAGADSARPALEDGSIANVTGYYAANDGGGGVFIFSAYSVAADDGGMTIAPTNGLGRWIRQIPADKINIRWFGAKPGIDSTAKIQAAIDYVSGIGSGEVLIPRGTFSTTATLNMAANVSMSGVGGNASIIEATNCHAITIDYVSGFGNAVFQNFGINGVTSTTKTAILNTGVNGDTYGVTFRGLLVTNYHVVVSLNKARNWTFENCWFQHINTGFYLAGQNIAVLINGNRFTYGVGCGVGTSYGIRLDSSGGQRPEGIQINDNHIFGFNRCLEIGTAIYTNFCGNDVSGTEIPLYINSTDAVTNIRNNYVECQAGSVNAIFLASQNAVQSNKINITGNNVIGDNVTANSDGIKLNVKDVSSNQCHVVISENIFSLFKRYDINIANAGNVVVSKNECYSANAASIFIAATLLGRPIIVENNFLTGYVSAPFAETQNGQVLINANSGTYSTVVRGVSVIANPATTTTTTYASLLGAARIPNFASEANMGMDIVLILGTPDKDVGGVWGTADESQVVVNIKNTPGAGSVTIPWEVKLIQKYT